MRNIIRVSAMGLAVVFLFAGCSTPQQAIDEAQAAMEGAKNEGADIYAAEELEGLGESLVSAIDEVEAQSKKFFKSYRGAKDSLARNKAEADALRASIPERKEKAKNYALAMMKEAEAAVTEANALVEQAPSGKGTRAEIEAFAADLRAMKDSLITVQRIFASGDFIGTLNSAKAIKEKAAGISEEIQQAIEKV